jgi:hypothetical protein
MGINTLLRDFDGACKHQAARFIGVVKWLLSGVAYHAGNPELNEIHGARIKEVGKLPIIQKHDSRMRYVKVLSWSNLPVRPINTMATAQCAFSERRNSHMNISELRNWEKSVISKSSRIEEYEEND